MELHFKKSGTGPPLVVLHGLFGSGDNYISVIKPLAEKFTVYVVDQRNHGKSPHHPVHNYNEMSNDLIEFFDKENLKDPFVLGHSMGGKAAMQLALTASERISKLIVVDISPRYYKPHHQDVISGLQAVNIVNLKSREEADKLMSTHLPDIGVRQFLLKNLYRTENGFAWRMNLSSLVDEIENIGTENKGTAFKKPALFLRGELSKYIQDFDNELIQKLFPDSKIITVEGAGHWVQAEKPEVFVKEVLNFLS